MAYFFTYNFVTGSQSWVSKVELTNCSTLNFPVKSFFSCTRREYLTFYRQGHCVAVKENDMEEKKVYKITDAELGSMYLIYEECLVVRQSSSILFFKFDKEHDQWKEFTRIDHMRG